MLGILLRLRPQTFLHIYLRLGEIRSHPTVGPKFSVSDRFLEPTNMTQDMGKKCGELRKNPEV